MLVNRFKRFWIKKKYRKEQLKFSLRKKVLEQNIKSVMILIDRGEQDDYFKKLEQNLGLNFNSIEKVTLNSSALLVNSEESIGFKKFSVFGKVKNQKLQEFLKVEFDLLINFTKNDLILNYLSAQSASKFKVGLFQENVIVYDLMLDVDENNQDDFYSELKKYLDIVNTK